MQLPVVILAGYDPNPRNAKKTRAKLLRRLGIDYLEGVNKGLIGLEETGYPILQKLVDTYTSAGASEVAVVGPADEFKGIIEGCSFIDQNMSVGQNFQRALQEFSGQTIAISTVDIPYVEPEHVREYFAKVKPFIENKTFVYQLVDKRNMPKSSWWKPSYLLIDNDVRTTIVPGHLEIVQTSNIPDYIHNILNAMYSNKGVSKREKFRRFLSVIKETPELNAAYPEIRKKIGKFLIRRLNTSEIEYIGDLIGVPTHIEITSQTSFAADVDEAKEELGNAIDYLRTKSVDRDRRIQESEPEEIDSLEQLVIANSQQHHPSVHTG